ncbi:hypothetical protein K439DRAFT_1632929 [Ramaria rubella]|nr:hypothetical protein K439DRAFT_1632929 [Ramaria rubella]
MRAIAVLSCILSRCYLFTSGLTACCIGVVEANVILHVSKHQIPRTRKVSNTTHNGFMVTEVPSRYVVTRFVLEIAQFL